MFTISFDESAGTFSLGSCVIPDQQVIDILLVSPLGYAFTIEATMACMVRFSHMMGGLE